MTQTILIVDDEEDIRTLYKEVLEQTGYTVTTADSGTACLQALQQKKYDLVLLDMFMPKMSGRETLQQIINNPQTKQTKIAFLSVAQLKKEHKEELKFLGAVDYINKPIENKELVERVKKILSQQTK
jgi:CheY-like chemotaxis protein